MSSFLLAALTQHFPRFSAHTHTHTRTRMHTHSLTKQADGGQTEFSEAMTCGVAVQVPADLFACGLCVCFTKNKYTYENKQVI